MARPLEVLRCVTASSAPELLLVPTLFSRMCLRLCAGCGYLPRSCRLDDFKARVAINWILLEFGGLLEAAKKATFIGEFGRLVIDVRSFSLSIPSAFLPLWNLLPSAHVLSHCSSYFSRRLRAAPAPIKAGEF